MRSAGAGSGAGHDTSRSVSTPGASECPGVARGAMRWVLTHAMEETARHAGQGIAPSARPVSTAVGACRPLHSVVGGGQLTLDPEYTP